MRVTSPEVRPRYDATRAFQLDALAVLL